MIITLISSTAVTISAFAFGFLKSKISLISVEYLLTSLALAPFVFVLPSIVVENRKVYQSLNRSFSVFSRKRGAALLPAMLLSAAFLPIPYLSNAAYIVAITLATVGLAVLRNKYTYTRNEEAVHGQQA